MKSSLKIMLKQLLNFNILAIRILACIFIFSSYRPIWAEEEVKIKSDFLSINKNDKKSVFKKNVLITLKNIKIKSDEAVVFFEKNENAPVKVIIPRCLIIYDESSGDILSASSMNFDNKTKEILLLSASGIYKNKLVKSNSLTIKLNKNKK